MKLTEAEMRMVFQIESTNQNAVLNEIYMTWRYAPNPATKETAESLLNKLRPLSDQECMSASELLSSRLMFPTPLASDNNTARDAASLDVFLSDNGIFRKRNRNGAIWSLSLSAAVFYLTPVASDGFRSTLKPSAFDPAKKDGNLSAQIISQEQPVSETAALNPDWVEWLMGFPKGWTDVSSGPSSPKESPA